MPRKKNLTTINILDGLTTTAEEAFSQYNLEKTVEGIKQDKLTVSQNNVPREENKNVVNKNTFQRPEQKVQFTSKNNSLVYKKQNQDLQDPNQKKVINQVSIQKKQLEQVKSQLQENIKQTMDVSNPQNNVDLVENADDDTLMDEPNPSYEKVCEGVLDIINDNNGNNNNVFGFIRTNNYEVSNSLDVYVPPQKIRTGLRKGDWLKVKTKMGSNKSVALDVIYEVNGLPYDPEILANRPKFEQLTPIYPNQKYRLELDEGVKTEQERAREIAIRAIDLVCPIGKGQRAMIVSPPKAGKTTLMKKVALSIAKNYPSTHLMVLLIDERPEEVTDMQRSIHGEVVYSTFDEMPEHHTKAAELVLERAKRLVEMGKDVVILMDSLTRLTRAYNLTITSTGRTLSGGVDPGALHSPKRFFGAARNIENGGSLTIIATALIDTGSRMDDVIFEEFKGTGNMEIHLDRKLTEKRIFPAIDLNRSGTRRDDLLLTKNEYEAVANIRKLLGMTDGGDATESLIQDMVKTNNNIEFMAALEAKIAIYKTKGFMN